jgi:signal transduction histidine kinase/CheY-like chemotaxis protein
VYRTVWPDGAEHAVNAIGRAVYDERGIPIRTAGVGMDVTERQRLEAQVRQAQKMDAIGQLAGGVAHDFNNLLTAIIGFTELTLSQLEPDHATRPDVQEILHAGRSAATLTRQLLAFSRKQMLQPQILDLNALINRMETLLRRTIGDHVQLVTRFDAHLARVNADPGQIEQVMMNLVINARDAMPGGGFLTIETATVRIDTGYAERQPGSPLGTYVMIAISDTGVGMDEVTRGRLFEPFFTTKEQGKGTGLGLATVYGIIKQSGGFVSVYSEVGRGTTFKVYLPEAEHVQDHSPLAQATASAGGTETILLVEDRQEVRAVARTTLARRGYTVLEADRGDVALALAKRHDAPIHLLLTDVVMPGMSGRELARQLLLQRRSTRVLYMSGYTDQSIVHHGVLEADIAFIQKPFSPDALLLKVRETLDAAR